MTKRTYILLWLAAAACAVVAQPRLDEAEIYLGGQAGVLASIAYFHPTVSQSALQPHWGANGGFVFRYNGHRFCGLQVELNYMQRGWHEIATSKQSDFQRRVDFIELPFMTHIYFGRRYRGYINFGPQIGFKIYDTNGTPEDSEYRHSAALNWFDYGVTAGLGFYARTKTGVWQIESRFNYSISNLLPSALTDPYSNSNSMNLSLNFAYLWELKKKTTHPLKN